MTQNDIRKALMGQHLHMMIGDVNVANGIVTEVIFIGQFTNVYVKGTAVPIILDKKQSDILAEKSKLEYTNSVGKAILVEIVKWVADAAPDEETIEEKPAEKPVEEAPAETKAPKPKKTTKPTNKKKKKIWNILG